MFVKIFTGVSAFLLAGILFANAEVIGQWDFAHTKGKFVPGIKGPQGEIIRLGKGSSLVRYGSRTLLKITGNNKTRKTSGGFMVRGMSLDVTKPFTIIFNYFFDKEVHYRATREFVSLSDGEKRQGFRVFFSWGKLSVRTGNGKTFKQVNSTGSLRIPPFRTGQMAVVYDTKSITIYMEGKKVLCSPFKIERPRNNRVLFGSIGNGFAYPLNGAIGDIQIFKRAFSATEAAEKYLAVRDATEE